MNLIRAFVIAVIFALLPTPFPVQPTSPFGTVTMGTGTISSGTCASAVTISVAGVLTTDNILVTFNSDPTGTTGYTPTAMLTVVPFVSSGAVNFKNCNLTANSITPAAITLNWRVIR